MEVRNLVTFLKVTELKSFSRAAEALDYSQSAVTVQIQQLERELGVQLFDRIGKTVSITQYGKDFVSYARDVVSAIARASAFASSDSELSGTVRVGTLNSLLTASFSNIVPLYHERFPHVQISLHAGNIASITEMLVKNELDIIYTLDEQIFDTQFVKVFEAQEDVVIVTNTENPLSARDDVHLADLVLHPFILMNHGNPYRDQFDRELARQDLSVEPFLELESDTLALKLIRENPSLRAAALHGEDEHSQGQPFHHPCGRLSDEPVAAGALSPQQGHHPADPGHARRDLRGREKAVLSRISQKSTGARKRACAFSLYCVITAQNLQKKSAKCKSTRYNNGQIPASARIARPL